MAQVALRDAGQKLQSEDLTTNNTVAIADSGVVLNQRKDGLVTTLPAVASSNVGLRVIVRVGDVQQTSGPTGAGTGNKSIGHEIAPNASDKIMGFGQAGTDDKSLLLAKANHVVGDYVILQSDGVNGWMVQEVKGAWTFEA